MSNQSMRCASLDGRRWRLPRMFLTMLKSKIHRATLTDANLNYVGSITVDEDLMEQARMLPNEQVQVLNINNGERLETYVIPGPRGSGMICLNGAAARRAQPGDLVIIVTYAMLDEKEARQHQPSVILVDKNNRVLEKQ